MPGDCTVTHSERTTHLGWRGDLKLPCLLFPLQTFLMLFAAHPVVPVLILAFAVKASFNCQSSLRLMVMCKLRGCV